MTRRRLLRDDRGGAIQRHNGSRVGVTFTSRPNPFAMYSPAARSEREPLLHRGAATDDDGRRRSARVSWGVAILALGTTLAFLAVGVGTWPFRASEEFRPARLGTGTKPVTFTVHLRGIPDHVWNRHVPWPVCRVKLVGCPSTGDCWHWRYHQGIEMSPVDDTHNVFTVTTSELGAGDNFGFAVVEAGCTVEDEIACSGPEEDQPEQCKNEALCDHRYDSGTFDTHTLPQDHDARVASCSNGETRCSSFSPFAFIPVEQRTCVGAPGGPWFNRVLPQASVDVGEYSAVWGSCASAPEGAYADSCMNTAGLDGMCALVETQTVRRPRPKPPGNVACGSGIGFPKEGICAEHCGARSCDKTCQAAVDAGLGELDCVIGGTGNDRCECSDGDEEMDDECPALTRRDWKCCTCRSLRRKPRPALPPPEAPEPAKPPVPSPPPAKPLAPSPPPPPPATCVSGAVFPPTGICTQHCSARSCDQTCQAAADAGYGELNCVIGGTGSDKCRCNNVGGGTADECPLLSNPGWKCCTCMSLR